MCGAQRGEANIVPHLDMWCGVCGYVCVAMCCGVAICSVAVVVAGGSGLWLLCVVVFCCVLSIVYCVLLLCGMCVSVVVNACAVGWCQKRDLTSMTVPLPPKRKTIPVIVHTSPRRGFSPLLFLINAETISLQKKQNKKLRI